MKKLLLFFSIIIGATLIQGADGDREPIAIPLAGAILQSTGPLPEDHLFTALISAGASERAARAEADSYTGFRRGLCIASILGSIGSGWLSTLVWPYFMASIKPDMPIGGNIIGGTVCGGILCALGCGSMYALRIACHECTRDLEPHDIEQALTKINPDLRNTFQVLRTENPDEFIIVPTIRDFAVLRTDHEQLNYLLGARIVVDNITLIPDEEAADIPTAPVVDTRIAAGLIRHIPDEESAERQ